MKKITEIFYFIFLLIFPLGQIQRITLTPTISFLFQDVVLATLIAFFFTSHYAALKKISAIPGIRYIGLFLIAASMSLSLNPLQLSTSQWLNALLYLVRFILYASLYPITYILIQSKKQLSVPVQWVLFINMIVLAFLGFLQYLFYPNLRNLFYDGWDPHYYRLFSTILDSNFAGMLFVLGLFLGGYIFQIYKNKRIRVVVAGGMFILLGALFLTYSRSSYLVLIVVLPLLIHQKKLRIGLLYFYMIFLSMLFFLPRPGGEGVRLERLSTIYSRVGEYQNMIAIIQRYPIFGVGFNAYRYAQEQMGFIPVISPFPIHSGSGSDNSFLFTWATAGIAGFISVCGFLIALLKKTLAYSSNKAVQSVLLSSIVAVCMHSFFVNSFYFPQVQEVIMVECGLFLSLFRIRNLEFTG